MTTKKPPAPRVQTPKGLKVFSVPIDSLHEDPANARAHPVRNLDAIKASLLEYGQQKPLVIDKSKKILAGNGLYRAAKDLGWTTISVAESDLEGLKAMGFSIADNRTQELSEWDTGVLDQQINELLANGITLESLGFDEAELKRIIDYAPLAGKDDVPEPPPKPITKKGDLWILGEHRLLCGDSTDMKDVLRVMDGKKANLFLTDPPYLVDYTGDDRPLDSNGRATGKDWSDKFREREIKDHDGFMKSTFTNAYEATTERAPWYVWHASTRVEFLLEKYREFNILPHQHIVWVKPRAAISFSVWQWQHEPCLLGWKKGNKPRINPTQEQLSNVWNVDYDGAKASIGKEHPTQKPVDLFSIPMRKHGAKGDICFEPFSGSGTQIIAAEECGISCRAIEIEPVFVDVAVKRWEQLTGQKAVREKS